MTAPKSPLVTLFAVPKPFDGRIERIQRNAISSWKALGPAARILLIGNEPGTAELADELGVAYVADIERNEHGTPMLNDAFAKATQLTETPLLGYVNADVILLPDFLIAVEDLDRQVAGDFLMIGRRTELALEAFSFEGTSDYEALEKSVDQRGRLGPVVCKDYFVFRRGQYSDLAPFSVGRGNWDNWMVASAKERGVPVVDATQAITAIHQNHDYAHVRGGRRAAYVTGVEARTNRQLAGGRNLVTGCASSHIMRGGAVYALKPVRTPPFWSDLRSFLGLVTSLVLGR